jgi:hypothetical protein
MRNALAKPKARKVALALLALIVVGIGVGTYTQVTAFSYADLLAALRAHGASAQESGTASNILFSGAGRGLVVNGVEVAAYEYGITLALTLDTNRISSDGATARGGFGPFGGGGVTVDWSAPPHHYRRGRVVVTYVGMDASFEALLTAILGSRFAGGTGPKQSQADSFDRDTSRVPALS